MLPDFSRTIGRSRSFFAGFHATRVRRPSQTRAAGGWISASQMRGLPYRTDGDIQLQTDVVSVGVVVPIGWSRARPCWLTRYYPQRPMCQCVLSIPFQLQLLFTRQPEIMGRTLGIVYQAIERYMIQTKKSYLIENTSPSSPLFLKLNTATITTSGSVTHYHSYDLNDRYEY